MLDTKLIYKLRLPTRYESEATLVERCQICNQNAEIIVNASVSELRQDSIPLSLQIHICKDCRDELLNILLKWIRGGFIDPKWIDNRGKGEEMLK